MSCVTSVALLSPSTRSILLALTQVSQILFVENVRLSACDYPDHCPAMDPIRRRRLQALLAKAIKGEVTISPSTAKTFLEAIYTQDEPVICIQRLVGSQNGLRSLAIALGCEVSITVLNGHFTQLLHYLQAPEIKALCAGALLQQVIDTIVQTPILWEAYQTAAIEGNLTDDGLEAFSWILYLLVASAKHDSSYLQSCLSCTS